MLLLVHPPTGTWGKDIYFPVGLSSLLATVRAKGYASSLLDLEYLTRSGEMELSSPSFFDDAARLVTDKKPDVVGLGTLAVNHHIVIELSRHIKKRSPNTKIVHGGPQASALAKETLELFHDCVDLIVVGEGERTLVKLLECDFDQEKFRETDGIAFWDGEKPVMTAPVALIEDLDELPSYIDFAEGIIKKYAHLCAVKGMRTFFVDIEAGRGCPFNCSYCATAPMWRRIDRRKSPERIFSEMKLANELFGKTAFSLIHDNFTASKPFVRNFCNHLKSNNSSFSWVASSRPDSLCRDDIIMMKDAGCTGFFLGFESGSKRIQHAFNKRLDLDKSVSAAKICEELDVAVRIPFILGHPEETREDANQSLELALPLATLKAADISFSKLCPLAGSADYSRYFDQLTPTNLPSDIALRPLRRPDTEELINRHPKFFAGFGIFPCKYMDDATLTTLIDFYIVVTKHYPRLALDVLEGETITPLEFFDSWLKWKNNHHPDEMVYMDWIHSTFSEFFRETYIKKSES